MYRVDSHEIELVIEDEPLIVTVDEPGSFQQMRVMSGAPDAVDFMEVDELTPELFEFLTYLIDALSDLSSFGIEPGELPQSEFIVLGTACSHALARMNVEDAVDDVRDVQAEYTSGSSGSNPFEIDTNDTESSSDEDFQFDLDLNDNGTVDIEDMR